MEFTIKRLVLLLFTTSFLTFGPGCTHWVQNIEFDSAQKDQEIYIKTVYSNEYIFGPRTYSFKNDTLFGKMSSAGQSGQYIKINLKEVALFRIKKIDPNKTAALIIGVSAGTAIITYLIVNRSFAYNWSVF